MKFAKLTPKLGFILSCALIFALDIFGQQSPPLKSGVPANAEKKSASDKSLGKPANPSGTETIQGQASGMSGGQDKKTDNPKSTRQESPSEEEAAILPYYNNYLREYNLGPEDVISVEVFGQANYSKAGIIIPPTARISYPLVPGGIFVGGKTVDEVSEEIKKKLDEYIIDPQVMVTLDRVASARFSILGKVGTPGVKVMNRRYNLYEAIAEAGGIDKDGDKKRVLLVRMNPAGGFTQTVINLDKMPKGKTEIPYLIPGDQIIVPEKRWSLTKIVDIVGKASALRILFGVPF
ncbi:MAG: polysaccharide export protein [Acidobacteriota bacterium]|nr:polysaccharide export protein [Acidobacteriota bacterium]